jgi:hypothetical protein
MRSLWICGMLLCSLSPRLGLANEAAPQWDFHGIRLGATEASTLEAFPFFECRDDKHLRRCTGKVDLEKHPGFLGKEGVTPVFLVFVNDRLLNVSVMRPSSAYDATVPLLVEKYGSILKQLKAPLKTRDGRSLDNELTIWHNGTSTINYERYYQHLDYSRLVYLLKE